MRLTSLVPSIPRDLVSALDQCEIRTEVDLLFQPIIEVYRQLPPGKITLSDLEKLVARVTELVSASGTNGADLLQQEMQADKAAPVLLTGAEALDNLLGGFGGRRVIEISGDRQSGKTALALHIVLRHLTEDSNGSVVWIDTTGDFSVERVVGVLNAHETEIINASLERLHISSAFDIETVYNVLEELQCSVSADNPIRCVVIDAITPLFSPILGGISAQGHSIMTDLMYQIRALCRNHSCPVLVINESSSASSTEYKAITGDRRPALGPSFTSLTDATVWLSQPSRDTTVELDYAVRAATVVRSKFTPVKNPCLFNIVKGKIYDL